jgi:hypothetical protein
VVIPVTTIKPTQKSVRGILPRGEDRRRPLLLLKKHVFMSQPCSFRMNHTAVAPARWPIRVPPGVDRVDQVVQTRRGRRLPQICHGPDHPHIVDADLSAHSYNHFVGSRLESLEPANYVMMVPVQMLSKGAPISR